MIGSKVKVIVDRPMGTYNPNDSDNKYIVSRCNEYTYKFNNIKQDGTWLLGEDKCI